MSNKYYLQTTKCKLVEGCLKYIHEDIYYVFLFRREIVMMTKNNCKYRIFEIFQETNNKYYLQMTKCKLIEGCLKYIHENYFSLIYNGSRIARGLFIYFFVLFCQEIFEIFQFFRGW